MVNFSRHSHSALAKWLWTVDKVILIASFILIALGVILDVTASPAVARKINVDDYWFVRKQLFYVGASIATIFLLSLCRLKTIRRVSIVGFILLIGLLILTLFFGFETKGAKRWMSLFGFSVQASEFMKPVFIIVTAWLLDCGKKYDYFPGAWIAVGLCGVVVGLLLAQPDVGMTLLTAAVFGLQLFLAGLPMFIVFALIVLGIIGLVVFYFTLPHFHARVDQFLYGSDETSYQINRAMEAFQHGNLVGQGPGEGTVKLLIPDAHTDFIFAVAGEELGLVGCAAILLLMTLIIIRVLMTGLRSGSHRDMLLCAGFAGMLTFQVFENIGMCLGVTPVVGITLPFFSYGGSSLVASFAAMGLVSGVRLRQKGREDSQRLSG